jgi:hypothetical protein
MTATILIVSVFLINIVLSWACARSEARAHNIENTFINVIDWCNNRGVKPPQFIQEDKIDKHALYTVIRGCFWTTAFISIFIVDHTLESFFISSFTIFSLLISFRAAHGTWYVHFMHILNNKIYLNGWMSDGGGKTSELDKAVNPFIKDSFIKRVVIFAASVLIIAGELAYLTTRL